MILAGSNIQSAADVLKKVNVEYLYHSILKPKPSIESKVRQLRIVRSLDAKTYATLKRQLPYVVCGIFNPPFRKLENFAYIEYFILDIDHLEDKDLALSDVRQRVNRDRRVVLSFASPSEDGLKLLFRLKRKCYDCNVFSLFYKAFLRAFSIQYGLEQVVDSRTSDATRACFISSDPKAYYNPQSEPVDIESYLQTDNPEAMFDLKHELESAVQATSTPEEEPPKGGKEPEDEVMDKIKDLLGAKRRAKKTIAEVEAPMQIEQLLPELKSYVEENGITLTSAVSIQYGKKLHFSVGVKQAEVNIFYGKRGFSIVKTPKSGTSPELNDMVAELLEIYIEEHC